MVRWLYRLLVLSLILMMQGPALLIQEIAWCRMLVTYSCQRGVSRAVVETFDGEHPCAMCAKAAALRQEEQRRDPAGQVPESLKRLVWMNAVVTTRDDLRAPVPADWIGEELAAPLMSAGTDARAPEPPPPREFRV